MEEKTAHVCVIGMGAIGSFYSYKYMAGGARLTAICHSDVEHVKKCGIKLVLKGKPAIRFRPHQVCSSILELSETPDILLICTKVLPSIDLIPELKQIIKKETTIVLIQNGIDIEKKYISAFPKNIVIRGLAFNCVTKIGPGNVIHQDYGKLTLGKYPSGSHPSVTKLVEYLESGNCEVVQSDQVLKESWVKLMWNAPFNPLSILEGGLNTRDLLNKKGCEEKIRVMMHEVRTVAARVGQMIDTKVVDQMIAATKKMIPYKTSMCVDYENNRPLEIEAILGNMIAIANTQRIEIPQIKTCYERLKTLR